MFLFESLGARGSAAQVTSLARQCSKPRGCLRPRNVQRAEAGSVRAFLMDPLNLTLC